MQSGFDTEVCYILVSVETVMSSVWRSCVEENLTFEKNENEVNHVISHRILVSISFYPFRCMHNVL